MQEEISSVQARKLKDHLERGLEAFRPLSFMPLADWADENFYMSKESSYIEGRWSSYPPQIGIMNAFSNDDLEVITLRKSTRVGYTKMFLAFVGYSNVRSKRNIGIWQPTDGDAEEFAKDEIGPMLRDVEVISKLFPNQGKKHSDNTLEYKKGTHGAIHIKGGKSDANYRRISIHIGIIDEIDGFDDNIEGGGDCRDLIKRRMQGAAFPRMLIGSTPLILDNSKIEDSYKTAEARFKYYIPCPHCDQRTAIDWGGPEETYGFKWKDSDPKTACCMCSECQQTFNQTQYLSIWDKGLWIDREKGLYIDNDTGQILNLEDNSLSEVSEIAIYLWAAYIPQLKWSQIVDLFIKANNSPNKKAELLQSFFNLTVGIGWQETTKQKTDKTFLMARREPIYIPPAKYLYATAGIDTQDDRFEAQIDLWALGEERLTWDYKVFRGDLSKAEIWQLLYEWIVNTRIQREDGTELQIALACQDYGGHFSDEVAKFSKKVGILRLIPVFGSKTYGRPIVTMPAKPNKKGIYLSQIGTDTAKELMFSRLQPEVNIGPGYWHWPIKECFGEQYFVQLTNEERVRRIAQGRIRYLWESGTRRNEPWDCSSYSLAAIRLLQSHFAVNLDPSTDSQEQTQNETYRKAQEERARTDRAKQPIKEPIEQALPVPKDNDWLSGKHDSFS